jgi:cytochrome c-type biogenesis protein CcmH
MGRLRRETFLPHRHRWVAKLLVLVGIVGCFSSPLYAQAVDRYPLPTATQQQQFQRLLNQFRCLVCQNQDLADSHADLAKDLRRQVFEMVLAHQTDEQIKQYMTDRYGDFILFKPPFNPQTWALWLTPFILLMVGGMILWRITHSRKIAQ